MTKLIQINGIRWGLSNVHSLLLKFPLNQIDYKQKASQAMNEFAMKELKENLPFDSRLIEFTYCSEIPAENTCFILIREEEDFFFSSEQHFIDSIEIERKKTVLKDEDLNEYWQTAPIKTFIAAFSYFKECMDDAKFIFRIEFDSKKVECAIKHPERIFFLQQDCYLTKKQFIENIPSFKVGKEVPEFHFVYKAEEVLEKLLSCDFLLETEGVARTLKAHDVTFKKEGLMTLDEHGNIIKYYYGLKENEVVFILVFPLSKQIKIEYRNHAKGLVYNGPLLLSEKSTLKVNLKNKLYTTEFNYQINEEIFNILKQKKKELINNYNISVQGLDPNHDFVLGREFSFDFRNFDRKKDLGVLIFALNSNIDENCEDHTLEFLSMIEQFIEDGHKKITFICAKKYK